ANVRCHDSYLGIAQIEEIQQCALNAVWTLRRDVHQQRALGRVVTGDDATALHEERAAAVLKYLIPENMFGTAERRVDVTDAAEHARDNIGLEIKMRARRIGLGSRLAIGHRGKRFVIDLDQLER